jgi:RNA polymerase sigma-70 factor (ECF subfamily)
VEVSLRLQSSPAEPPSFDVMARLARLHARRALQSASVQRCDWDDVTQKVLLAVFRCAHTYDPGRPLDPWLRTIAERVTRDHRALAYRGRETLMDDLGLEDSAPDSEQRLVDEQTRRSVQAALATLDERLGELLLMHDGLGVPMAEVASSMGICVNTAYTRLARGRKKFRGAWRRRPDRPRQVPE